EVENRAACLFHLALSYEKLEDYFNAFLYFDQYVILYPDDPDLEQARWHRGLCCYPLAQKLFEDGEIEQAFYYLDEVISAGQPQHLVDDAYFLRGEILLSQNFPDEAKEAFSQVVKLNRVYWKEKIAEQARKRIQEIEMNKRIDKE
ncbi:MAG: tetratricopeptide repeat protein, partial [Gemmatimonadota bacterium]|nr:tetratricopeptide repeat protein [Gemmatimonadota bacterium]